MFWRCIHTNAVDDPAITATKDMVLVAREGLASGDKCYWLRGIVPGHWTMPSTPPTQWTRSLGKGRLMSGYTTIHIYTDGSGGLASDNPRCRRCGWAWVVLTPLEEVEYGEQGHLYTEYQEDQTVPNSEYQALIEALNALTEAEGVEEAHIYTDHKSIYTGFQAGKEWCQSSSKSRLWDVIWNTHDQITARGTEVEVHKLRLTPLTLPSYPTKTG